MRHSDAISRIVAGAAAWCSSFIPRVAVSCVSSIGRPARQAHRSRPDRHVEDLVGWLSRGTHIGAAMLVAKPKAFDVKLAASTIGRIPGPAVRRRNRRLTELWTGEGGEP